jgi:hypothetical protein
MDSPAFASFCDALSINKGLIELDLRNNDISHVGASELAVALKRNVTLRVLGIYYKYIIIKNNNFILYSSIDLRWNNIGLVGARALLALCQSNSTLNELHLTGNNAPDDIMANISKEFFSLYLIL